MAILQSDGVNNATDLILRRNGTEGLRLTSSTVQLTSVNDGPLAGFRNAIINGNFDNWQRNTSFSNPASSAYTSDRWVVTYNGSGATRTISRGIFNAGSTEAAPGARFFLDFNQSVAGSAGTFNTLNQRIESVRTFGGQTITLSFYARGFSASLTMPTIILRQNFGSGGSAFVDTTVASSVVIAASTFARYTFTVTLPSITGKTIGTSSFLELILFLPVNTTFIFQIASVQVEAGSVATPFEERPFGTELALCQRYFYKSTVGGQLTNAWGSMYSTSAGRTWCPLPVPMRASPTMTYNGNTFERVGNGPGTGTVANTIVSPTVVSFDGISLANLGTFGQPFSYNDTFNASAEL